MVRSLIFAAALSLVSIGTSWAEEVVFDRSTLWIETENGSHKFDIEVASTPEQLRRGLMERADLAHDAGMLFDHEKPRLVTMWMANTLISLDMLFIVEDGTIVRIAEWAEPLSRAHISSDVPVRAVLEINGGTSARLGIRVGDKVKHDIFGNE